MTSSPDELDSWRFQQQMSIRKTNCARNAIVVTDPVSFACVHFTFC
jgi:hypothetical protein